MDKIKLKYFVDLGMGLSFLVVFFTGIFKFPGLTNYFKFIYRIIPGFNISRVHDWAGLIMGIFVFVHLVLNWNWIVAMTKNIFKGKK